MRYKPLYFAGILFFLLIASYGFYKANPSGVLDKVDKGEKAPDIKQPNPEGETMKLSDLKGHIVLIDFWASWCRPCIAELPHLRKLYNRFKDKEFEDAEGFEIYSVSLDNKKRHWKSAIDKFKLGWDYHVSDLKGWNSKPASKYGVRAIPATFLVDENGVVIGKNWHLDDVEWELEKRLKD